MTSEHFLQVKKCRVTPTPKEWGIPEISTCLRWSQGERFALQALLLLKASAKRKRRHGFCGGQIHLKTLFLSALGFGECTDCDVKKIAWTICSVRKDFAMRLHQFSIVGFWSSSRWMDAMFTLWTRKDGMLSFGYVIRICVNMFQLSW